MGIELVTELNRAKAAFGYASVSVHDTVSERADAEYAMNEARKKMAAATEANLAPGSTQKEVVAEANAKAAFVAAAENLNRTDKAYNRAWDWMAAARDRYERAKKAYRASFESHEGKNMLRFGSAQDPNDKQDDAPAPLDPQDQMERDASK